MDSTACQRFLAAGVILAFVGLITIIARSCYAAGLEGVKVVLTPSAVFGARAIRPPGVRHAVLEVFGGRH